MKLNALDHWHSSKTRLFSPRRVKTTWMTSTRVELGIYWNGNSFIVDRFTGWMPLPSTHVVTTKEKHSLFCPPPEDIFSVDTPTPTGAHPWTVCPRMAEVRRPSFSRLWIRRTSRAQVPIGRTISSVCYCQRSTLWTDLRLDDATRHRYSRIERTIPVSSAFSVVVQKRYRGVDFSRFRRMHHQRDRSVRSCIWENDLGLIQDFEGTRLVHLLMDRKFHFGSCCWSLWPRRARASSFLIRRVSAVRLVELLVGIVASAWAFIPIGLVNQVEGFDWATYSRWHPIWETSDHVRVCRPGHVHVCFHLNLASRLISTYSTFLWPFLLPERSFSANQQIDSITSRLFFVFS